MDPLCRSLHVLCFTTGVRRAGLQDADAADLVQDVVVVLFQKLPEFTYDPLRSFRTGCAPSR